MWFPTMIQRMDESKATSVCAVTSLTSNKTLCDFSDETKVYCDFSDETKVYFDTFLQAAANLPGHLIYFLLVNSVGRKPIIGKKRSLALFLLVNNIGCKPIKSEIMPTCMVKCRAQVFLATS